MYKVSDIARYIINHGNGKINNLRLQCLLYYAWVEYYKAKEKFLFKDIFTAWKFGYCQTDIYFQYCAYGGNYISLEDAAEYLNIKPVTLRKWIKQKKIFRHTKSDGSGSSSAQNWMNGLTVARVLYE